MALCIFFDNIIVWATSILHFKGLGMRNLQYEMRICQKKVVINSQRQFMYGSNFYGSDVSLAIRKLLFQKNLKTISARLWLNCELQTEYFYILLVSFLLIKLLHFDAPFFHEILILLRLWISFTSMCKVWKDTTYIKYKIS